MNATIQYDITGRPGRDVERGHQGRRLHRQPGRGRDPQPHAHDVLAGLARHGTGGKLSGQMAFMSGKLKLKGDMGLAMKVGSLFQV